MLHMLWQHKKELSNKIMEVCFTHQTLGNVDQGFEEEGESGDKVLNPRRQAQRGKCPACKKQHNYTQRSSKFGPSSR